VSKVQQEITIMKTKTHNEYRGFFILLCLFLSAVLVSCSGNNEQTADQQTETSASNEVTQAVEVDPLKNKGIGPFSSVEIGAIDQELVVQGQLVFESKCAACHKFEGKYVGPSLGGITSRRTPEWIMNMIMNPVEMTQKDPIGQELLEEYLTQMTYQDVSEEEARAILEFFRDNDEKAQ
jgi:mono/diheme cytochrome c family protein